jgi:hypothetical protein
MTHLALAFLSFLLLLVLSCAIPAVNAQQNNPLQSSYNQTVPQPSSGLQLEIPKAYFVKGIVHAEVQLKNNSGKDLYDLMYGMRILSPASRSQSPSSSQQETVVDPGSVVGYQDYDFFSLKQGEALNKKIEFKLGSNFENGTYRILINVRSRDNQDLAYQSQSFPLTGSGRFLTVDIQKCSIKAGNAFFHPSEGPIVKSDQEGVLTCEVSNPTDSEITAKPRVEYGIKNVPLSPNAQAEVFDPGLVFQWGPKQTRQITIPLPKLSTPQVYEGFVNLLDDAKTPLSPYLTIRWTVPGPSATIVSITSNKDSYSKGEEAQINVQVDASADLFWNIPQGEERSPVDQGLEQGGTHLKDAVLKVSLIDGSGNECGSGRTTLPDTTSSPVWPEQKVNIKINKDCPDFAVRAEVEYQGSNLATLDKSYGAMVASQREGNPQGANLTLWRWVLGGLVAIVVIIAAIIWYRRNKTKNNPPSQSTPSDGNSVSSSTTMQVLALVLTTLGVIFFASTEVLAAVKLPIDDPISAPNVSVQVTSERTIYANVSNFSSVSPSGRSSLSTGPGCSVVNALIYGHARANLCSNVYSGYDAYFYIDGQPTSILSSQSNDSFLTNLGGNAFRVYKHYDGVKTGSVTLDAPASARTQGDHQLEVKVYPYGKHWWYIDRSNPSAGTRFAEKTGTDYISLAGKYFCNPCAAGEIKPHLECDPITKTCKTIDTCGVNSCTPGANQCGACDNPNEIKPHKACVNQTCTEVNACGTPSCNSTADCCPPGSIFDPATNKCIAPACNISCTSSTFCQNAQDGCTVCNPDTNTCQPPASCNSQCESNEYCQSAKDGCSECRAGTCQPPGACNAPCTSDVYCQQGNDSCSVCEAGVCKPPASCNSACTSDKYCQTAQDGCIYCQGGTCQECPVPGQTNPHGACDGPLCKPVAACGVASCGNDLDCFSEDMCKCDGFNALNLKYPSDGNFKFEAFAKVLGKDIPKAKVESITFRLYKSSKSNPNQATVVAKSDALTPQVVENTSDKVRYKAAWDTAPPTFDTNAVFRVGAEIKCTPKSKGTTAQAESQFMPGGKTYNSDSSQVANFERNYSENINYSPIKLTQLSDDALQLGTINFVRLIDSDSCQFLRFEYLDI